MTEQEQQWHFLREGKPEALEYFFRRYYEEMYNYSIGLLQDEALAQDQIQHFFLRLWERHSALPLSPKVKPYLFRALRFAIIDEFRRQKRSRVLPLEASSFVWQESPVSPVQVVDTVLLRTLIQKLSATQQEIIFLRFYNQLPYPEIAEIMGMRHQSVRNAAHRGIKKLRLLLRSAPER